MRLLNVDTLSDARRKLLEASSAIPVTVVRVPIDSADGMTLAEDLKANEPVPPFPKSTVDGYAVQAKDTAAASESVPVFLRLLGEIPMGAAAELKVTAGTCVYVPTGGMVPSGADAVVMVEYSETFGESGLAVSDSVSPGRNVIPAGEDIEEGETVITKGTVLRAQEIGVLASVGITEVPVIKPWKVTILSTGDELMDPWDTLAPGQIRDSNSWTAAAQCRRLGMEIVERKRVPDQQEALREAIIRAKGSSDLLIVSGGSSQGKKDYTAALLDEGSDPGVFTHGISVKPGKPTILASDKESGTLMIGLPGHPVASMILFELLAGWLLRQRAGTPEPVRVQATLDTNLPGGNGRTLCQPVKLYRKEGNMMAAPVLGHSGILTTLTGADGYLVLDGNIEGLRSGAKVEVILFQ